MSLPALLEKTTFPFFRQTFYTWLLVHEIEQQRLAARSCSWHTTAGAQRESAATRTKRESATTRTECQPATTRTERKPAATGAEREYISVRTEREPAPRSTKCERTSVRAECQCAARKTCCQCEAWWTKYQHTGVIWHGQIHVVDLRFTVEY